MKRLYAFGTFVLFSATGCTPQPTPTLIMPSNFASTPKDYKHSIQNYFALKAPTKKVYDFKEPIKAYKREGFAYGGNVSWQGWLVDVKVNENNIAKPYMILFKNEQIVDVILGNEHKLITRIR
ncbi:MAG: hypothetical protein FNT15_08210 [Sulfurovum sp.]|nr:MAG: hypothetical protein FNT15_08210 [Sulfurovum sp.]